MIGAVAQGFDGAVVRAPAKDLCESPDRSRVVLPVRLCAYKGVRGYRDSTYLVSLEVGPVDRVEQSCAGSNPVRSIGLATSNCRWMMVPSLTMEDFDQARTLQDARLGGDTGREYPATCFSRMNVVWETTGAGCRFPAWPFLGMNVKNCPSNFGGEATGSPDSHTGRSTGSSPVASISAGYGLHGTGEKHSMTDSEEPEGELETAANVEEKRGRFLTWTEYGFANLGEGDELVRREDAKVAKRNAFLDGVKQGRMRALVDCKNLIDQLEEKIQDEDLSGLTREQVRDAVFQRLRGELDSQNEKTGDNTE